MITIIPLIDDYLQLMIVDKLKWLKDNPIIIDHIFSTGKRETLSKLKDFIQNRKVKVIIGYPQNQTSLPAYVITLAPEQEQPAGLGDNYDTYNDFDLGIGEDSDNESVESAIKHMKHNIAGTYMNATYRIECWSDNGDLTAYMYVILKWCLWSSRKQMLELGWVNITMSGSDLEPVPDYMPVFIYRRASQVSLIYENLYYENLEDMKDWIDIIKDPDKYHKDEDGNIVDDEGNIIIPYKSIWIINAHFYEKSFGDSSSESDTQTTITSSVEFNS